MWAVRAGTPTAALRSHIAVTTGSRGGRFRAAELGTPDRSRFPVSLRRSLRIVCRLTFVLALILSLVSAFVVLLFRFALGIAGLQNRLGRLGLLESLDTLFARIHRGIDDHAEN